jgi:hypothetical protein
LKILLFLNKGVAASGEIMGTMQLRVLRDREHVAVRVFEPCDLRAAGRIPNPEFILLRPWIALE